MPPGHVAPSGPPPGHQMGGPAPAMGGGNAYRPPGPGPSGPGPAMGGGHAYGGGNSMGASAHGPSTAAPGGGRPAPTPVRTAPAPSRGNKK
jgi:hypothetical protein